MRPRLVSPMFALICATTLAFFTSLTMQAPVFPGFLRARAGASPVAIGFFIGLFNFIGVGMRPFVGRALARRSRRGFMILGGSITAVASSLYLVSDNFAYLTGVRLLHGLSIGAFYTATATLVADIAPDERRGEALSYFSMFLYVGLAMGGALGQTLEDGPGYSAVFLTSSGIATVCALLAIAIREPRAHSPETEEMERHPFINRAALFPGSVLALGAVGYASMLNFSADFSRSAQIPGATFYFPTLALTVIVIRAFAGVLADRFGRLQVALPGLIVFATGLAIQSSARDTAPLLIAAVGEGAGFGFFWPSMMAFTIDRVRPVERGSAMGTITGSFDLGFALGSLALGAIQGATDYPTMYRGAFGFTCAGAVLLAVGARRTRLRSSDGAASASS